MCDKSDLTCEQLLEAIIAKASVVAKDPELFTVETGWKSLTDELDKLTGKLDDSLLEGETRDERQKRLMDERDAKVRKLIILMRVQLAHSYLFDDLQLQASQGCTLLGDYAELKKSKALGLCGHKFDGIEWNAIELSMMPDHPNRRFDFDVDATNKTGTQWEYCSCLDHAISNLICKVWGYSNISNIDGAKKFKSRWQDLSLYLAVLLCFGDNILDDQKFLREIGANLDEADTPQKKLLKVLSVPGIRGKLWKRTQELIPNRG